MIPSTWLVTGASGFVGRHVIRELATNSAIRVVGTGRRSITFSDRIDAFVTLDSDSVEAWSDVFRRFAPAVVLHLAGRTPPADRATLVRDNFELTRILLDALERVAIPVRFVHCGSAAELGDVPVDRLPVGESCEPNPLTDYGRTKWDATRLVLQSPAPIEPVVGRIFNVIGPGQPANQVFGRYARDFASSDRSRESTWEVSGLANRRDFVDVRDVARALIALAIEGESGTVYHIANGVSRSVGDGLAILARAAGLNASFADDSTSARGPSDSVADISRILKNTSWRPTINFERTIEDLWREAEFEARTE